MTIRLIQAWNDYEPGDRITLPDEIARLLLERKIAERDTMITEKPEHH